MGNLLGGRRVAGAGVVVSCLLLLTAASCGGGGDGENPFVAQGAGDESSAPGETETTGLLPCAEDRHVVAFDVAGLLTMEEAVELLTAWMTDGVRPTVRPGTAEVASAYRERGYEVLYMVGLPVDTVFVDQPVQVALEGWLVDNGFPVGPGTHYWFWDAAEGTKVWTSITNEMVRLSGEGAIVDAGYTENPERAYGMAAGGVPTDRLFTLESIPVTGQTSATDQPAGPESVPLPGDDFTAHLADVQALPPVCQL